MLEMKIDNEEVVSKNNFTIKEEMQTASSTILNNTYPKSWEIDKDYISRFYYPKDYSKLDLENHIHINPEEGSIATIDSTATIQGVDTNKLQELINVEGKTEQNGTPTPDAPIPVEVVSGRQEVNVCGKNLAQLRNDIRPYGGNTTSTIIVADTTTRTATLIPIEPNTQYTMFIQNDVGTSTRRWFYYDREPIIAPSTSGTGTISIGGDYGASGTNKVQTITTPNNAKYLFIQWTDNNSTKPCGNVALYKGSYTSSTLPSYEPYIGNTYSINLGKNLLKPKYETFTMATVTCTYTKDGLLLNGTPTANASVYLFDDPLPVGNYIINGVAGASSSSYQIVVYKNGSIVKYLTTTNYAFEVKEGDLYAFRFYIFLAHGEFDNVVLPYQIEKGNVCTSYSPYFTPIELCKIGNYKDRIFKGVGSNLFDKDTTTFKDGYYINDSGTETSNSSVSYTTTFTDVEPNTEYTLSGTLGANGSVRVYYYDSSKTFISRTGSNNSPMTFTTPNNCYYIQIQGQKNNYNINTIMLNKGSTPLPYEPYLAKDKRYIEKYIGKVVLTGDASESWTQATVSGNVYFYINLPNSIDATSVSLNLYSNYFLPFRKSNSKDDFNQYRHNLIVFNHDITDNLSDFRTWLSTHNTIIYYVLGVPTYTEITNEELISQLNSIELLDGLNNVSITSPYLTGILQIHYNYVLEEDIYEPIFYGIVKNTSNISMNPRYPKYCSLQILDYKTLLSEGKCLDFVIYNKTISQAINMVVSSISGYGFELGNINILNPNEIIGTYSTNEKTAYDVLNYLADISGAKWSCRRKDKDTLYIDFYDPSLMPKGKTIEYTTEWACENNLVDLQFKYGTRDYRNKQIILSHEVSADITYNDMLISDGLNKEFTLPNKVAKLEKIEINNEIMSIATTEEKSVGIYADFYYSIGTDTITSNKTLPYGTMINISYVPIIQGREVVQNDNEINRIGTQLNIDGTISRYEIRNDENDSSKLLNIGETYLKYKGEAEITLTIKTHNNDLYNVGQSVYFDAPIQELKKDYLVKSKEINIVAPDGSPNDVFYTYTLSSSFNSEKEINWFDNQRNKLAGNIKDGEFISRNIDINNSANIIWDNLQISEITTLNGDNDLNAVLDAPLIH